MHFPPNGNKLPPRVSSYIITKFSLAAWHNVWRDVHTLNISDKSSGSAQLELLRLSPWLARSSSKSFDVIRFLVTESNAHRLPSGQISWGTRWNWSGCRCWWININLSRLRDSGSAGFCRKFPGGTQCTPAQPDILYRVCGSQAKCRRKVIYQSNLIITPSSELTTSKAL